MSPAETTPALKLYRRLDEEIRRRPRGTIAKVAKAVGRSPSWWHSRAEAGGLTVAQLLGILDELGLDPVKFLREALDREGALELDRPSGEPPELVKRAWERFLTGKEGRGVGRKWIETLDELQYEDPEEVVRTAEWHLDQVELELLPLFLGVVGSAWRLSFDLGKAAHTVSAGIEMAKQERDLLTLGKLIRRMSSVVADQGDRQQALELAEKAAVVGLRLGDRSLVGSSLVAQGIWLYYLDRSSESLATLQSALDYLPETPSRNRLAVFQVSGLAHQSLGNSEAALASIETAESQIPDDNSWDFGKILWLRARIHATLDDLEQSARLMEKVVAIFRRLHLGEAAVATCDLVEIYLRQGLSEKAFVTAGSMRALVEPLASNKIISAAIADLLRAGRRGLKLALVKEVVTVIEGEREKGRFWQTLGVANRRF